MRTETEIREILKQIEREIEEHMPPKPKICLECGHTINPFYSTWIIQDFWIREAKLNILKWILGEEK